jgi:pimeloyl-ACP methyl ester carboxylesterase
VSADETIAPPSKLFLLAEGRAAGEFATTLALMPLLRRAPRGDGHPVLLLPGFLASDFSTRPLRRFLRGQGWWTNRWKLGRNLGFNRQLEDDMLKLLRELAQRHGRKVSLVGWSLGGVYARALANHHPELVRCVVSLGSPFAGSPRANNSWRLYEWITGTRLDELDPADLARVQTAPPVPTTSIFSRTDGITAWRSALQPEGPLSESIEIPGSHLGLGFNPLVLYAIADRLAEPEGAWRPFFRPGVARPLWRRPTEAMAGTHVEAPA